MVSAEIRKILLSKILSMEGTTPSKYSTAFNTLKSIINIELKERSKERLPEEIFIKFRNIEESSTKLDENLQGFPLLIIEEYFFRNIDSLDKFIYLAYNKLEYAEYKVINIYEILEQFFQQIYFLAVEIADFYSIEIKLKSNKQNNKDENIFI